MTVSETAAGRDLPGERLWAFKPDAARVRVLDTHMRRRLSDSLQYIVRQAQGHVDVPPAALAALLARLDAGPVAPVAFSHYSDLVVAVEDDDLETVRDAIHELLATPSMPVALSVIDLGDPARDIEARQFVSFINSDPSIPFEIGPPSAAAAVACRQQIDGAMRLLDAGDPALAGEIRALLRQVVLAAGSEDPKAYTFDGASSFMMWGAIILNANRRDGDLGMVQMLAHESAHNLLFGIGSDEMLVRNEADALFTSPLRPDPRPMDGIYHATFVSARMYRAVRVLLDAGVLPSPVARAKAQADLAENARLFRSGYATVRAHGDLSPLGQAVMDAAVAYMDAACPASATDGVPPRLDRAAGTA